MSLPHVSVATIDAPEFINLQPLDLNPLMSSCEIKVFYVGENRNGSYIKKSVATEMAKTLRGAPIVGYYKQDKEDFGDHGRRVTFEGDEVIFETLTKPYGFVSPDAKVWFKKFTEEDEFGNPVEREYLMTTGYLWTEQFEECKSVVEQGKPQSMELDEKSIEGHWTKSPNSNVELFIINDAIFSKLCILGDDVEPCFEGSSVTAPASTFSLDKDFKNTLFSMMKDLKYVLEGGKSVENENMINAEETQKIQGDFAKTKEQNIQVNTEDAETNFEKKENENEESASKDKNGKEDTSKEDASNKEEDKKEDKKDKNPPTKNSLHTDEEYDALQAKYDSLSKDFSLLKETVAKYENKEKDELIAKCSALENDADFKAIVENKSNYTFEDMKTKLALLCFEKGVSLKEEAKDNVETKIEDVVTYSFNNEDLSMPDWIKEVKETQRTL